MSKTVKLGIIGCGNICDAYINGCKQFPILEVYAVADIAFERAEEKANTHGITKAYLPVDLMADEAVDIVINLTIPAVHAEVSMQALKAGKHVYSEKPLATNLADGKALVDYADANNLRLGCAPDTFLGGGLQSARQVIDDGLIGEPIAANAFMLSRGVENWHPNPDFFFKAGGGPMFDMGPYYLTALIQFMGSIKGMSSTAAISFKERVIGSLPLAGQVIEVETPTHISCLLEFNSGKVATLMTSFDVWSSQVPRIEIYGSEGTLSVPDPNTFGGPVLLRKAGEDDWTELELTHSNYTSNMRGLGVADIANALQSGRPHRASGQQALHVLDAMETSLKAAAERKFLDLTTSTTVPKAMNPSLLEGELDS